MGIKELQLAMREQETIKALGRKHIEMRRREDRPTERWSWCVSRRMPLSEFANLAGISNIGRIYGRPRLLRKAISIYKLYDGLCIVVKEPGAADEYVLRSHLREKLVELGLNPDLEKKM